MDIKKYIYGHCVSPKPMKIWDAYSSSYITRLVPCGRCLHCQNTHINEWCTRLIAQKKYSKYTYFVSLDYAPFTLTDPNARLLARETAACYHDINKYHRFGMHPLVLCKNHLQDFFKRLRKNTKIKIQYFACGEYGTHANGRGFGRPHFHCIIFSNDIINVSDFETAWSINGYKIGRVDFTDMSANSLDDTNNLKTFKYVCKYLQKSDFDFERLVTIDFHRTYFESMCLAVKHAETLFGAPTYFKENKLTWCEYTKLYSPFVVCSRRPSIGSAYLVENLERFKTQDFRLFGLPKECSAFPRYYVRRTKESFCDFHCIGTVSKKPTTSSRLGYISTVLRIISDAQYDIRSWTSDASRTWRLYKTKSEGLKIWCVGLAGSVLCSDLNFYDKKNKYMYQFNGVNYNVWAKLNNMYALMDVMSIPCVLQLVEPSWDRFHKEFLTPMYQKTVLTERQLLDTINALYPSKDDKTSYELFWKDVDYIYQQELASRYKTNLLMQNSKQTL